MATFQELFSDPRFREFSLGLLAQSGSGTGGLAQAIGRSGLSVLGTQEERLRNQILRNQLVEQERRRALLRQVPGLLGNTVVQGPDRNFTIPGVEGLGDTDFSIPSKKELVPLLSTPGGQSKLIGLLSEVAPEALLSQLTSQLFSAPEKPTGLAAKFDTIEGRLGRPLTDKEILKLSGGGTVINIGDLLNEPIPIPQLASVRLPDGSSVPIGTTFSQARDVGAQVVSPDERKSEENARSAKALLDQLEALAIGPEGIFNNVEPGFFNRVGAAFQFALEDLDQPGAGKVSRFKDLSLGSISKFVRSMGEKGALAEGDVQRALGLLPRLFPLPDTGRVARDKLRELREIITRGIRNNNIRNQPVVSDAGGNAQPAVSDVSGNAQPGVLERSANSLSGLTAQVPGLLSDAGSTLSGLASQVPGLLSDAGQTIQDQASALRPSIDRAGARISGLTAQVPGLLSDAGQQFDNLRGSVEQVIADRTPDVKAKVDELRQIAARVPGFITTAGEVALNKLKKLPKVDISKFIDNLGDLRVLTASEISRARDLLSGVLTDDKLQKLQKIINNGINAMGGSSADSGPLTARQAAGFNFALTSKESGLLRQPGLLDRARESLAGLSDSAGQVIRQGKSRVSDLAAQVPGLLSDAGQAIQQGQVTIFELSAQVSDLLNEAGQVIQKRAAGLNFGDIQKRSIATLVQEFEQLQVLSAAKADRAKKLLSETLTTDKLKELQEILARASLQTQKMIGLANGFTLEVLDD